MLQIGILGVGGIAGAHLKAYQKLTHAANVIALCDIVPERANGSTAPVPLNLGIGGGTATQARPYMDYRQFLANPDIDIVDICLPTDLHAEATIAALEAGKHVLCEKPMALNVNDCDRMIAAAKASDRFLMIAQCIRFWPVYTVLKQYVDAGTYGAVTSAFFRRISARPQGSDGWFTDPARSGGCILDLHIHDVDFIAYLLGMPRSVLARGVEDDGGISYVMAEYRYAENQTIFAEGGWHFHRGFPFYMTFLVHFEHASVEMNEQGQLKVYPESGEPFIPSYAEEAGYYHEIAYFLDCVARGVQPAIVTPWDARETIRLIAAERESIRTGQPVAL